jgi:hypothetical protein
MAGQGDKCDGALAVLLHSPRRLERGEDSGVSLVGWSTVHQLQRHPDPRDDSDASQAPAR